MDLAKIRKEIDATDDQILSLFLKRMELCVGVAKYGAQKTTNGVF